jgi:hypothetical protein
VLGSLARLVDSDSTRTERFPAVRFGFGVPGSRTRIQHWKSSVHSREIGLGNGRFKGFLQSVSPSGPHPGAPCRPADDPSRQNHPNMCNTGRARADYAPNTRPRRPLPPKSPGIRLDKSDRTCSVRRAALSKSR